MFSRIKKLVLGFLVALISASFLVPQQAQAQDIPVPIFVQLDLQESRTSSAAQMCLPGTVTLDPIPPASTEVAAFQIRDNMLWVPTVLNFEAQQCVPAPEGVDGSVGPVSPEESLITFYRENNRSTFQEIGGGTINTNGVAINPTLPNSTLEDWATGDFQGSYPARIEGMWITEMTEANVAEGSVLIPPDPFENASLADRLMKVSDLYGNATFIRIQPEMVLYLEASETSLQRTLASFQVECPALDVNDFHAIYLYSFPKFTPIGPVMRMDMWSKISHTPKTFQNCVQINAYTYLNGQDTWSSLAQEQRDDVEQLIAHQAGHVRRNIMLRNLDGSLFPGLASMDTIYNGEVAWIGIAVVIGGIILKFIAAARGAPVMP